MDKLKPRQLDIMQNLVRMLEKKGPVKVTTATLAKECGITEAAIYRHFPSKRKIYSGLVDFCEDSLFNLIAEINSSQDTELEKIKKICELVIGFCEKNPGMARLLTREAFTVDEASVEERINQIFSKTEIQIKQLLQKYEQQTKKKFSLPVSTCANLFMVNTEGLIQQFVRSGFNEKISSKSKDHLNFFIANLLKN